MGYYVFVLGSLRIMTWSSQNRCSLQMHFFIYVHMLHSK